MRGSKSILKKLRYVVAVFCVLFLWIWFNGLRPNSVWAGRTGISRGAVILKQVSFGKSEKVDIFKTNDGYATTLVKQWGPFWYESKSTSSGEASSEMNIIGFINFFDPKSESGTVFAVLSNDKSVSYLSAGPNSAKRDIKPHVITVLSWNQSLDLIDLNAVAYSKNNQPLYKIKNAKVTNGASISIPIKFYPVR